ncbi:MAG: hypothetical protein WC337_00685 [Candidatus Muiribacteriota bacterium]
MKFINDGWYGIISDDFNFKDVKIMAKAITKYLVSHELNKKPVIIGYDTRFLSYRYAQIISEVLLGAGIKCYISERDSPTIFTSATLKNLKAGCGIQVTGKELPYFYNGIFFLPEYGGPPFSHISMEIERNIRLIRELEEDINTQDYERGIALGLIEVNDLFSEYSKMVDKIVDFKKIKDMDLKIVVDYINGSMRGYLRKIFPKNIDLIELNTDYNPYFSGRKTDPYEDDLEFLCENVKNTEADLGVAFDTDGGNIVFINRNGEVINRDIIAGIVLDFILKTKNKNGVVVKTMATTGIIDLVCEKNAVEINETYIGFKHVVEKMLKNKVVFGCDDKGGISFSGHVPVKDSLVLLLLFIEVLAVNKKSLEQTLDEFEKEYGHIDKSRFTMPCETEEEKLKIISKLKSYTDTFDIEEIKESYQTDGLKIVFKDKTWFYARINQNKPLLEIVIESSVPKKVAELENKIRKYIEE